MSGNDFKYLTEEFGSKNLELLKQKGAYPYQYMDSFKRFGEEKLPDQLHILHSDYPLAPEKLAIPYDLLLVYCKQIADKYEIVGDVVKFVPNLGD